jgi:hypothetical protein
MIIRRSPAGASCGAFRKKLAQPKLAVEIDTLVGTLNYGSVCIATGTMGYQMLTMYIEPLRKRHVSFCVRSSTQRIWRSPNVPTSQSIFSKYVRWMVTHVRDPSKRTRQLLPNMFATITALRSSYRE